MLSMPRQFRCAGPMRMKDTSDASLMSIRHAIVRHPNDIKYVAIYKMSGNTMVLVRAHDNLSVLQWRTILGTDVQEILPIKNLSVAIFLAKQQEGFEEFGSMGRKKANTPRVIKQQHVDAGQEQVVPSPQPIIEAAPKKQAESLVNNPYMVARRAFLKTLKGIRQAKKKRLVSTEHVPVDLSLADYKPGKSVLTKEDMIDSKQQAEVRARTIYAKYLEDYRLRQSSDTKRLYVQMVRRAVKVNKKS